MRASLRNPTSVLVLLLVACFCVAQTQPAPQSAGTVLRLRVRVKTGDATRGLSRKRFFLIKGSLEQNKTLVDEMLQRPFISRDCYYRAAGASDRLINWLKENDCESVYCRELQPSDVEAPMRFRISTAMTPREKEMTA